MSRPLAQNAITLDKISHHFESGDKIVRLFNDLNLVLEIGKSTAIIGPSGAGKSSLLTLAAGLESPKNGDIHFHLGSKTLSIDEMRQKSGFIFQQFHLLPELDAISNLALPLRLRGDKEAQAKAEKWLDKVGLGDRADHKPSQLSGGEQQRIAIARAFITDPSFIFADEPTGNLDEDTSGAITELMFDCVRETGAGLVLVTHSQTLAARADKCFRLSNGKLEEVA
ncbi:MAG: ABC transporter ATP-binding protein [Kordiimonas sp.]